MIVKSATLAITVTRQDRLSTQRIQAGSVPRATTVNAVLIFPNQTTIQPAECAPRGTSARRASSRGSAPKVRSVNPFTPKLKEYILPTFYRENV